VAPDDGTPDVSSTTRRSTRAGAAPWKRTRRSHTPSTKGPRAQGPAGRAGPRSLPTHCRGSPSARCRAPVKPASLLLLRLQGVQNPRVPRAEVDAYVDLLRIGDGSLAFLKIMRGLERTRAKRDLYQHVLGDGRSSGQVVWDANDPTLRLTAGGEVARRAADFDKIHTVSVRQPGELLAVVRLTSSFWGGRGRS
jgi:hypothetical protein